MNSRSLITSLVAVSAVLVFGQVRAATWYVAENGSDATGDGTVEHPFATISNAFAHASSEVRDTIRLADGTYGATASRLNLNKAVEIAGNDANPRAVTVDGLDKNPFALVNHADVFIHGIRVYRARLSADIRTSVSGAESFSATPFEIVKGVVSNCIMEAGYGLFAGGISVQKNSSAKVYDTVITGTLSGDAGSPAYGGGLRIYGGLAQNCVISNNTCTRGAGAYVWGGTVRGCRIVRNVSGCSTGAGVYMVGGTVEDCAIVSNKTGSTGTGGGVYMEGGTIRNSLVAFNTTGSGGGIYIQKGSPVVQNCTVAKNTSSVTCDGIYMKAGTVVNTAVDGEEAKSVVASGGSVTYSCSMSLAADEPGAAAPKHNVRAAPGFRDAEKGDFTLVGASPCVDAGSELSWHADAKDVSGVTDRVIDGKGTGTAVVDIGAYEYDPSKAPLAVTFSAVFTPTGTFPQSVTLTPCLEGSSAAITAVTWDFGDGTTDTTLPLRTITHDYVSAGYFTIKLSVTVNGVATPLVCEIKDAVKLKPTTVYVAKGKSATAPYDTLDKATDKIEDALSALAIPTSGRAKVIVADGTYAAPATRQFLESAIEIAGNDADPYAVVFDGNGKNPFVLLNHADAFVHGIRLYNAKLTGVSVSITGCATYSATAFEVVQGIISNCVMDSCTGSYAGGISVQNNANAKVYDTVITRITTGDQGSPAYGGGLRVYGGLVQNCTVTNNTCTRGAGARVKGGIVRGCRFVGNVSGCSTGAGVYIDGGTVEDCVIVSNKTSSGGTGGGVYMEGGTIRNSLVAYNTSGSGAGIYIQKGSPVVQNCTIAKNTSSVSGDGIYMKAGSVVNTAVDGEEAKSIVASDGSVTYSCSMSLTADEPGAASPKHNVRAVPGFRDAESGDFTLVGASPCVDAGSELAWHEDAKDVSGETDRVIDGKGTGTPVVDIGAYEYDPSKAPPSVSFSVSFTPTGVFPQTVTLTPVIEGAYGTVTSVLWEFGDGSTDMTLPLRTITHDYATVGYYTVRLTVTASTVATPLVCETVDAVKLKPTTVYLAKGKSATAPYDTLEKATESLEDALSALAIPASGRAKIIVADGTYPAPSQRQYLEFAIEIAGNDADPRAVTFDGADANAFVLLNHADAFVHGVRVYRLRIGNVSQSVSGCGLYSGSPFEVVRGVISNCVMEKCYGGYAGGISVQFSTAKVYDTVVTGSRSEDQGSPGYGGGFRVFGGLVQNCVASNNACARGAGARVNGGTVRGCRFVNNSGSHTGGGLYLDGGTVENCLVVSNTAVTGGSGGGGVYQSAGTLRGALIVGNTGVSQGGGLYQDGGTAVNVTIADNESATSAGAKVAGTLVNSIVMGKGEYDSSNPPLVISGGTVSRSCSPSLTAADCLSDDPRFVSPAKGNYQLRSSSKCVGFGDNAAWPGLETAVDLNGKPRLRSRRIDLGAYECEGGGFTLIVR